MLGRLVYTSKILRIFLVLVEIGLVVGRTSEILKVKLDHGGVLVGRHLTTVNGRHMRAFMGVPYAKPPVGELRFKVNSLAYFVCLCVWKTKGKLLLRLLLLLGHGRERDWLRRTRQFAHNVIPSVAMWRSKAARTVCTSMSIHQR